MSGLEKNRRKLSSCPHADGSLDSVSYMRHPTYKVLYNISRFQWVTLFLATANRFFAIATARAIAMAIAMATVMARVVLTLPSAGAQCTVSNNWYIPSQVDSSTRLLVLSRWRHF